MSNGQNYWIYIIVETWSISRTNSPRLLRVSMRLRAMDRSRFPYKEVGEQAGVMVDRPREIAE